MSIGIPICEERSSREGWRPAVIMLQLSLRLIRVLQRKILMHEAALVSGFLGKGEVNRCGVFSEDRRDCRDSFTQFGVLDLILLRIK